ncbi:alpha/beta fold hydrolase [Streptomyces sp. HMX112]|uniref:alpha/beta fold hydrolase n=1 Tax=Streptomyces sp. HMX112 TaxID=3390850 RepID=UPI003A80A225
MTLSHDVAGDGPVVVLLHSSVCDRRMWEPQWRALAGSGYRTVRCDFRGYGDTPAPDLPHRDADDVLDLLDALGAREAALVGASYGGRVALEAAARHSGRVTAVALLCAAVPGHEPSAALRAFDEREEALLEAGDLAGAVELNVTTWLGPAADEAARRRVRDMQRHAFEVQSAAPEVAPVDPGPPDLAAVRAPCLAVSGAHDLPDFREAAARLAVQLPDARHVELDWAGHLPGLERPSEVTALLTGFLGRALKGVPSP